MGTITNPYHNYLIYYWIPQLNFSNVDCDQKACDFIFVLDIVIISCGVYKYVALQDGESALMKASHRGCRDVTQLLLDVGAQVNLHDNVSAV